MNDLIEKIRAVLDEDERLLRLQCPWPWKLNAEEDEVWAADDELVADAHALSSNQQRNTARFIVRFDPGRAERQIAAMRKILELHQPCQPPDYANAKGVIVCSTCGPTGNDSALYMFKNEGPNFWYPCDTMLALGEASGITP